MRINYLVIGLVLLALIVCIPAVSAQDAVEDYNITIPDGYHIENVSDNFLRLESDKYHTISMSMLNDTVSKDTLVYMLESSGYDFLQAKNYTKGDFDIIEIYYTQEYQQGILYLCDNGDELLVMDYKVSIADTVDDSPVEGILDELARLDLA